MRLTRRVHGFGRLWLFGTVFVLMSCLAWAQRPMNSPGMLNNGLPGIENRNSNQLQFGNIPRVQDNNEDTTGQNKPKPPKFRKPLESYLFDDSLRKEPNFVWNMNLERNTVEIIQIDTVLKNFQNDYPFQMDGIGDAYLGNLGGPTIPLDYFSRADFWNFSLLRPFDTYLMTPERVKFFNVKKPFSHLSYFTSGQVSRREENFWATHAQNISPTTGFNLDYKSMGTRGMYLNQGSRNKNLSLAVAHTGKKYTMHAGYIYNNTKLKENGGISRDWDITDTVFEQPELLEIRLQDAENQWKSNTFYVVQSYGIPLRRLSEDDFSIADQSSFFLGHSLEYTTFSKNYTDTEAGSNYTDVNGKIHRFYDNWFINSTASRDSTYEGLIANRLFVQIQPWDRDGVVGVIDAGVGHEMHHYQQFKLQNYLYDLQNDKQNSTYFYGAIQGHVSKYVHWQADAKYHPFGMRSQDISMGGQIALHAKIKGQPVILKGDVLVDRRSPTYWMDRYFSNHFVWGYSSEKEPDLVPLRKETESRISIAFMLPSFGTELGMKHSLLKDKIYFDQNMKPAQKTGSMSVMGLYAQKDFRLGGFHLNHQALLQFSSDQLVVPVPLASAYLSYFYEFHIVQGVLRLQLGVDGRINTKYYAFGYNPATAQFFNQREKELGGYPVLDLFAAAKWKRMRILAKMQHLNENLFGERNYFTVLHYPLNRRMFKVGISWTFYD